MAIKITDTARRKLEEYLNGEASFLRISVKPGGCSGMTYDAAIDSDLSESDEVVFESKGVRIVADDYSKYFLGGLQIDFSDDLIRPGFRLNNPNSVQSCGCGASFCV